MARQPAAQAFPPLKEIEGAALATKLPPDTAPVVMSFDLSSSCIGWAVGIDGSPIGYGKYVFKSTAKAGEKLVAFTAFLDTLIAAYRPDVVLVEKPLAKGKTVSHFEFLGVLRVAWRNFSGKELEKEHIIDPRTVKAHLKVKRGANHAQNKEFMIRKINTLFRMNLKFSTSKYESDDDTADAIAVMVTYWMLKGKFAPAND